MKRLFLLLALAGLVAACEPDDTTNRPPLDNPNDETEQPEEPSKPEEPEEPEVPEVPEEPEEPERPENAISTLQGDLALDFNPECSMCYADCFGDYYKVGQYMWGFYFQNYTTKEQLYIEVMHPAMEYAIPLDTFTSSDNIYMENALLIGGYDFEGYQVYSWYTALATADRESALAPIAKGTMTITHDEETGNYTATFDLEDDAGNAITGVYSHRMILEDFRI